MGIVLYLLLRGWTERMSAPHLPGETEEEYDARVYHIYSLPQLAQRAAEAAAQRYLVEHLVPTQAVVGLFGDSGLGKTPFIYQMLLCVSAGIPFLGLEVEQGAALYLGYEDSTTQTNSVIEQQMIHLGLGELPKDFHVWSVNDASPDYGLSHKFVDLVKRKKPKLVVLDPIASFFDAVEDSATNATRAVHVLRGIGKDVGCSTLFLHHLKKTREEDPSGGVPWEELELSVLLQRARGSNAIVSAIDTRIMFGKATTKGADVGVKGRGRGQSEFPTMLLSRDYDDAGDVLGYTRMTGIDLVSNLEYRGMYERMPERFRFTDAVRISGKSKPSVALFCKGSISAGILRKEEGKNGLYVKVRGRDSREGQVWAVTSHASDVASGLVATGTSTSAREFTNGTSDYGIVEWGMQRLADVKVKGDLPW